MKRFSSRHQLSTLSELNVTPLLDLAFVLLIIFMITTPLMESSSELVVPTSRQASGAIPSKDVEMISVDRDGLVTLNKTAVPPEGLEKALAGLRAGRSRVAVVIRAHRELPVQKLVEVMDALKKAGITKIGVISTKTQEAQEAHEAP